MKKLQSMVQYILEMEYLTTNEVCDKYKIPHPTVQNGVADFLKVDAIKQRMFVEYAKFLNQTLELWMFVPCDVDGSVLTEPSLQNNNPQIYETKMYHYQNAKDKVLFEKSEKITLPKNQKEFSSWIDFNNFKTIEDIVKFDIVLTKEMFTE